MSATESDESQVNTSQVSVNLLCDFIQFAFNSVIDSDTAYITHRSDCEIIREPKYITFHTALMQLFLTCLKCMSSPCSTTTRVNGTLLSVQQECPVCKYVRVWSSQPLIGNHRTAAGNLLLSAAILYTGASPTQILRVLQFISICSITKSTFFRHQSQYLLPSIHTLWNKQRLLLLSTAQSRGTPMVIGGDARADSPGHSAKFGSYSVMDLEANKIVDVQLIQVRNVLSMNTW